MSDLYLKDDNPNYLASQEDIEEMSPLEMSELYLLENLVTVQKDGYCLGLGFKVGDKLVREICNKCGGYGGDQMEDGWMSCYRCAEVGYTYLPVDLWIMNEYHWEAYQDNQMIDYEHEMEAIKLMHRQETRSGDPADAGINNKANFIVEVERNDDDIPF